MVAVLTYVQLLVTSALPSWNSGVAPVAAYLDVGDVRPGNSSSVRSASLTYWVLVSPLWETTAVDYRASGVLNNSSRSMLPST